jgi:hypothetical protein
VSEVGHWLAAVSLDQYRSKFVHHVIDGALLLRLGDAELKVRIRAWLACAVTCGGRLGLSGDAASSSIYVGGGPG